MRLPIAYALAAFQIPVALSHVLVTNAFGNADRSAKTYGIGLLEGTNRANGARINNQRDVTVFSDPTMAPNGSGQAKKAGNKWKRNLPGCGRTYYVGSAKYYIKDSPELKGTDSRFPNYNTARLNTTSWIEWMVDRNLVAKATAGGWLNVTMSQQNTDGGGPYMCELDESGTGESFTPLEIVGQDCAGRYGANLCKNQDWYVGAILPKDLDCKGTTIGEKKTDVLRRICILRCKNDAPNGPFGGCIPFQQVDGPGAKFPPLGKQNFCKNGFWPGSPYSDKFIRFLAGNYNIKQADMDYLVKEAGAKRTGK
ncbi:uncharacterized protein DFL_006753 [Arthrobotrys flagrans]|uniref:Uncharacterized protein n=1 Tax=Arthrobotrys flagrans TaxID=97331 RepID=A0A436ZU45_ARTFL|nr:hypothetical protein DFL_006753 [Arthrobotrys flagrans]